MAGTKGKLIGYARVSTTDQDLSIQRAALEKAGCDIIRQDKASGTKRDGRNGLRDVLEFLREGDTLVVLRLDRLGRSLRDLSNIAHELEERGAALKVLDQNVDTSTSSGRAFFGMLAVFAQFETDVRKERQLAGIEAAKAKGVYKGRVNAVDPVRVQALKADGLNVTAIAKELGCSRPSVYAALGMSKAEAEKITKQIAERRKSRKQAA
jgi:DNA invertase Pin-like site-specific DNA recombinase